ncbi:MAG: Na+/H+ antiporter NhaA [Bacteroidota bacterium]
MKRIKEVLLNPISDLVENGKMIGILLIGATIFSLSLSNSEFSAPYLNLWHTEIGFSFLHKSIEHWINDGLMAVFFLLVGIEIKREFLRGELANREQAILPVVAALGGIMFPVIIFCLFNGKNPEVLHGWAIPTATDIAFSLGILSLLGSRIPFALKVFLTALAIIDDLAAIVIIAIFYTNGIHIMMLLAAMGIFAILLLLNLFKVRILSLYLITGLFLWYFILKSGIHATIAGVLLALAIPGEIAEDFEHQLNKPVNYLILPLFALANTALQLSFDQISEILSPLSLGIMAGLFLGKPLGITLASWILIKIRRSSLPQNVNWKQVAGLGLTAGIGFTMSIFIASLSFVDERHITTAKLAILTGSFISAIGGLIVLRVTSKDFPQ